MIPKSGVYGREGMEIRVRNYPPPQNMLRLCINRFQCLPISSTYYILHGRVTLTSTVIFGGKKMNNDTRQRFFSSEGLKENIYEM